SGYATNVIGTDGPNRFAGICMLECDNSAGNAGDMNVEVLTEGVFELPLTAAQASVGKDVYATDNYTLSVAQTADAVFVGRVERYVSATLAGVQLGRLNKQDRELNVNAETLAGTKTLTVYDARIQALDP